MKSSQSRLSSSTNKEEEWVKFVLKFKAIVDERDYVCILNRSETVPAEKSNSYGHDEGREMSRLRKLIKRGYRECVLARREMSLTIV